MIVVYGAGAYGTALAVNLHKSGKKVTLLSCRNEHAHNLLTQNENELYLKGVALDGLTIESSLDALSKASLVLLAMPAQAYVDTIPNLKPYFLPETPLVICSKGIGIKDGKLLHETVSGLVPNPIAALSGPHFAREVAELKPSAVTLACTDLKLCHKIIEKLSTPSIRLYGTDDIVSVQLAGALKNVIAIACGIARGLDFGENAIAALITRGLSEIRRLGLKMGGKSETFLGLSGIGDLTLTCSSLTSRNTTFGMDLAKGLDPMAKNKTVEGYHTTLAAYTLKQKLEVRMPIVQAVYDMLYEGKPIKDVLSNMLAHAAPLEQE